jgi:hypothetical protein
MSTEDVIVKAINVLSENMRESMRNPVLIDVNRLE